MFYIDTYGMTLWRLSSLVWMALVALGLVLVAIKVFQNRSNLWLLNANLASALAVLLVSAPIDYRAIVANWNADAIANQIAARQPLNHVDLKYLASLGTSAVPAFELIFRTQSDEEARGRAAHVAALAPAKSMLIHLDHQRYLKQAKWQTWTLRYAMSDQ
jgi:hypothetical protein